MISNSAKYGPLRRPTATASSQPQCQKCTAGLVDQLWTKADIARKGEKALAWALQPGVGTRQNMCVFSEYDTFHHIFFGLKCSFSFFFILYTCLTYFKILFLPERLFYQINWNVSKYDF